MTLTLILLAIGNMLLLMAIRSLRKQRLKERHALLFVAVGVPFLALAVWPDAIGWLSGWLGIEYQTVLLLAVTTFFLVLNFNLLSIVSIQERRITSLHRWSRSWPRNSAWTANIAQAGRRRCRSSATTLMRTTGMSPDRTVNPCGSRSSTSTTRPTWAPPVSSPRHWPGTAPISATK